MSQTESLAVLVVCLILLRGLGESSLSVISMALVSKWFSRRISAAMGFYSVLIAFGFVAAILSTGEAVKELGWREAWLIVGGSILVSGLVIGILFVRSRPVDSIVSRLEFSASGRQTNANGVDFTLMEAIRTPVFWCFALGAPLYALAMAAISLFNESLMKEQGFGADKGKELMAVLMASGVLCNLLGGWLGMHIGLRKLLGGTLLLLAVALALFPTVETSPALIAFSLAIGGSGGVITVVFFTVWAQMFGRAHVGQIQGAAQVCSVLASATGPLLLAECRQTFDTSAPFFYGVGAAAAILGTACWLVPPSGQRLEKAITL